MAVKPSPAHENIEEKKKLPKGAKIFMITAGAAAVLLLAGLVFWSSMVTAPASITEDGTGEPIQNRPEGIYNVLVAGKDRVALNTDTIMLVSLNTKEHKVNILSIPRDTMSNVKRSVKKINAAYGTSGKADPQNLLKEVKGVTGIMPDRYAIVDLDSFIELIDTLGGVEIDVQRDMNYEDPAQDLFIHINKGMQVLDGKTAMGFVRYRKGYADADLGRIKAQQQFVAALASKLKSPAIIAKIPALIKIASGGFKTNMTAGEMLWFATQVKGLSSQDVSTYMIPGTPGPYKGISYFHVNEKEALELINDKFNPTDKPITDLDIIDPKTLKQEPAAKPDAAEKAAIEQEKQDEKIQEQGKKEQKDPATPTEDPSKTDTKDQTPATGETTPPAGNGGATTTPPSGTDTSVQTPADSGAASGGGTQPPKTGTGDTGTGSSADQLETSPLPKS